MQLMGVFPSRHPGHPAFAEPAYTLDLTVSPFLTNNCPAQKFLVLALNRSSIAANVRNLMIHVVVVVGKSGMERAGFGFSLCSLGNIRCHRHQMLVRPKFAFGEKQRFFEHPPDVLTLSGSNRSPQVKNSQT